MQLYKGEEKDGKIDWVDPQPLATKDSLPPYLENGRAIFQSHCGSCHALDKDLTGPALSGVEGRGPWNRQRLLAFTHDPATTMAASSYLQCQKAKFGTM